MSRRQEPRGGGVRGGGCAGNSLRGTIGRLGHGNTCETTAQTALECPVIKEQKDKPQIPAVHITSQVNNRERMKVYKSVKTNKKGGAWERGAK